MNFIKNYASSISEFVTHVMDNTSEPVEDDSKVHTTEEEAPCADLETQEASKQNSLGGLFGWIPSLKSPTGENAVVYYMNSLASLGSEPTTEPIKTDVHIEEEQKETIVEDVQEATVPPEAPIMEAEPLGDEAEGILDLDMAFINWINGLSSRTEQVWQQMKQDLTEVVSVISVEPKDAVTRTASSVRQHLSSVAEAARKIDTSQFSLLPENTGDRKEGESMPADDESKPPEYSELPSLSNLRTDVSNFVQGVFSSLFGSDGSTHAPVKDRREARLHVLRADPATYEVEPPSPPAHLGVLNYADWRAAYFDEVTCQPLPGIPLSGTRNKANEGQNVEELLQPSQPSPEELLDQNPFMRTYLSQLVRVEGQADNKGISDGDFWSRYYYRVWLLDVTELRRRRLADRVGYKAGSSIGAPDTKGNQATAGTDEKKNDVNVDSTDWFDTSDTEAMNSPAAQTNEQSNSMEPCDLTPTLSSGTVTEAGASGGTEKSGKRGGKQRKRRGKKRSEGDRNSECSETLDSDAPNKAQLGTTNPPSSIEIPAVITPGLASLAAVDTIPTNENARTAIESDEPITSGSSSVVVLSNSEDDPEGRPSPVVSRLRPVIAGLPNTKPASDEDLDDWGEVCEDEFETIPSSGVTKSDALSGNKGDEEDGDWDNWS